MNLLKKNMDVLAQRDYYDYPKKKPVSIALGIIGVVVLWILFQTMPAFVMTFIDRSKAQSLILIGVGNCLATAVLYFFFVRKEKKYFPKVVKKMTIIECLSGAFFQLVFSGFISMIVDCIKFFSGLIKTDSAVANLMSADFMTQFFVSVITASIAEEVLLRGCVQNRIMARINNIWAIVIAGAIFGLSHGNVSQFITATVSGIAFCFVYAKTRSLWAAIVAHMINNLVSIVQADYAAYNPNEAGYWILTLGIIIVSAVLSIPFIKADAAVIEKRE